MEEWREFKHGKGIYFVSSLGGVKNKKGVTLKQGITQKGYAVVYLFDGRADKKFFVHRLVALSFIPNDQNKPQVNHKDSNRLNNSLPNLEWCTQSENTLHSFRFGNSSNVGSKNPCAKLNEGLVREIRAKLLPWTGYNITSLAQQYGVGATRIRAIRDRKNWSHV